ncbi:hypothetical protein [Georgenia ruanii]|uniref:hypothetical protein n=1 Tax=Georgenia ruanii TaxID=348442 RepID=UPI00186ADAF3|nr:hypothetical protein [Georgenia ruanii]
MDVVAVLVPWLVGLFVAYWVIRLAVRHGILDADHRRAAHQRDAATGETSAQ